MKVLIESVKIRMQISSQKTEFEKDCIGEVKIYIFFFSRHGSFCLQEMPV